MTRANVANVGEVAFRWELDSRRRRRRIDDDRRNRLRAFERDRLG